MKTIWAFLMAIPELIKLFNSVIEYNKKMALEKKVNDDLKKITEAYRDRDSAKLVQLFDPSANDERVSPK